MSNEKQKKSVVTIMDRHYMGRDENDNPIYIFNCNHVAVGIIDPKDYTFVDTNGNEYPIITNPEVITSEVPYAYANAIDLKDVKSIVNSNGTNLNLKDSISMYEFSCKQLIYYVGKTDDGNSFCMAFNTVKLKESVSQLDMEAQEETEEDCVLDLGNEEEFDNGLRTLINNAISGKYSIEELDGIIKNLEEGTEDIMDTIEALEYQLSAMKNNTSYSTEARKAQKVIQDKKKKIEKKEEPLEEDLVIEVSDEIKEDRIDINKTYEDVTKVLISQDEPARRVIVEIAKKFLDERKRKEGILLAGPTGVGKTKLMELIAESLDKPFIKVDTTQLTVPGYVGKDIEEVLWDLYVKCGRDMDKVNNAIIYFDEIDKKGSSKKSDVSGQGVLNVLLPFIEGSIYDAYPDSKRTDLKVKVDTTNMTVILGGAFTDVYKNMKIDNEIGFGKEKTSETIYREAEPEDFVEYGQMTNEFMGRVVIVKLNDLSIEDLKNVLLKSEQSALKIEEDIFEKLGVKVKFTDGYINAVAEKAYKKKTGARGLGGIVDKSTWKALDEISNNPDVYKQVTFDEKSVEDSNQYKLTKIKKK